MKVRTAVLAGLLALPITGAPATASAPDEVTIDVDLVLAGNLEASTTTGTFVASGGLSDTGSELGEGRFAGQGHLRTGEPNSLHASMTLVGDHGTITLDLHGLFGTLPAPLASGEGRWVIAGGTGAYASVHGRGSWTAIADFRDAFAQTGPPRVAFVLEGTVN